MNRTHGTGNSKRLINPNNISAHWIPNLAYIDGANSGNREPKVYLRRQFAAIAEAPFGLWYRSIRYLDVPSYARFVSLARRWRGEGKKHTKRQRIPQPNGIPARIGDTQYASLRIDHENQNNEIGIPSDPSILA